MILVWRTILRLGFSRWKYLLFRKKMLLYIYTLLVGVTFSRMRIVLLSSGLMWIDGTWKSNISFQWWWASRSHSNSDDGGGGGGGYWGSSPSSPNILYIYIYPINSMCFFHGSVLGEWEINSGTWLTWMNFSDVLIYRWFQFPIAHLFPASFLTQRNDMYKRPIQI